MRSSTKLDSFHTNIVLFINLKWIINFNPFIVHCPFSIAFRKDFCGKMSKFTNLDDIIVGIIKRTDCTNLPVGMPDETKPLMDLRLKLNLSMKQKHTLHERVTSDFVCFTKRFQVLYQIFTLTSKGFSKITVTLRASLLPSQYNQSERLPTTY